MCAHNVTENVIMTPRMIGLGPHTSLSKWPGHTEGVFAYVVDLSCGERCR